MKYEQHDRSPKLLYPNDQISLVRSGESTHISATLPRHALSRNVYPATIYLYATRKSSVPSSTAVAHTSERELGFVSSSGGTCAFRRAPIRNHRKPLATWIPRFKSPPPPLGGERFEAPKAPSPTSHPAGLARLSRPRPTPKPYARRREMPPESDAASLAASVLAASTPKAAAAAVSSVADFLRRYPGDRPRAFFADALPPLLFRLFVASPSSPSFIDLAAGDAELTGALASLLRPDGPLLEAAFDADRCALLRFAFPRERLPRWLQLALTSAESDEVVSPLLAGRIGSELHLSVFEYYLFWFAYYPISSAVTPTTAATALAGTPKTSPSTSKPFLKSRARLESWVSNLASTAGRSSKQKVERPLYLKLLYAYLKEFVPGSCVPARGGCGTLLRRTFSEAADATESFRRAEFFVHTLLQFWLVGDDFSPLPVQTLRAYGFPLQSLQPRAQTTITERLPSPGLGNAVKLLVMYVNKSCGTIVSASNVFEEMPSWKKSTDVPVGVWNQFIHRPMYRFLLRTFLFCPMGADMEHAAQVFSAWMMYIEPWKVQQEDFDEYDLPQPGTKNVHRVGEGKRQLGLTAYTPAWQGYVLSNYLFYSSLVVHFLGFAHKFIHSDVALVLQMLSKVSTEFFLYLWIVRCGLSVYLICF